jgi:lipoprotein-anchoring transpeptidase ErfK/SrfK
MGRHMARHSAGRSASRTSFAVLSAAAVVAVGIWAFRSFTSPLSQAASPDVVANTGATADPSSGQLAQSSPRVELVRNDQPASPSATQPTTQPASLLSTGASNSAAGNAEQIFANATAKRDAGDLVTARDMVNAALQAGRFDGSNADDAKAFIGTLNEKIILGTQKYPADAFNKEWKVEPGTVLVKLAKRFDVTAELLCKVNGLSRPDKLRAGANIKIIQGPFHLVVSKSKFEGDIYLGAPGGPNSMFVKTVRVGLGSDGSTPTGTWQVDSGKVLNPVYYSSRGEGVIAADDPKNPLGERWIPLKGVEGECVGKESYGIHGTIEPSSIGKNMSMGCIRLGSDDINLLYDLLIEGKSMVKVVD